MTTRLPVSRFTFDMPATYQIQIEGQLDATCSPRLEGMAICVAMDENGQYVTHLTGELGDQAALSGVLIHLYEMQKTVLSVSRL